VSDSTQDNEDDAVKRLSQYLENAAKTPPPIPAPVDSGHWSDALDIDPKTTAEEEIGQTRQSRDIPDASPEALRAHLPVGPEYDKLVRGQWSKEMAAKQAQAEDILNKLAKTIVPPAGPYAGQDLTMAVEGEFISANQDLPEVLANLALPDAIRRAETLKAEVVDAERRLKDFLEAKVKAIALVEARVREHVLMTGASYMASDHMKVSYVKPAETVKWNTDKLMGFAAALSPDQKAGLLACRTVEPKPASTTLTYK